MLCGACWNETATGAKCAACGAEPLLDGRYRLDAKLGQGAGGIAFAATRVADGLRVCIKGLAYRGMTNFDAERLFRREASVLRQIEHPQVPAYIDDFALGAGPSFTLYLVQELVVGSDLEAERQERRPTVPEVVAVVDELLGIVAHLHALSPPIVHRDIKLRNVMRRAGDGRLVLVDFGSVKEVLHASFDPGLSVQGTLGYMAPEQLRGEASPRSDLYAIGMVAVALLSGREPATMLGAEHEVRWQSTVDVDARLREWLRRMTAADPMARFGDAAEARRALSAAMAPVAAVARAAPKPQVPRDDWSAVTDEAPSDTSDKHSSRFIIGAVLVLSLLAIVAWAAMRKDDTETVAVASGPIDGASCAGTCRPVSTPFKERLRFGMTLDEAKAARADVAQASDMPVPQSWLPYLDPELKATRVCMSSELVGSEAQCCLDFNPTLGRLTCATVVGFDKRTLLAKIAQVASIYGPPQVSPTQGQRFDFELLKDARWDGDGAELLIGYGYVLDLAAKPDLMAHDMMDPSQRLVMTQTSAAWSAAEADIANARERADAAERARAAAERQEAIDKAREERKKLGLPADPL